MLYRSVLLAGLCFVSLTGAWAQENANITLKEGQTLNLDLGSILVCKANQCVATNHNMSREYLHHQVASLLSANTGKGIRLCEADASTHQCVQNGISLPIESNTIHTMANITKARLVDARSVTDVPAYDFIIDYKMKTGDIFPSCQTALSRVGMRHAGSVEIMSPKFNCRLTQTGTTTFSLAYHVDYIDFDRGVIGAMYSIAADNQLKGNGSGYVLLDFDNGVKMDIGETFPYPEQMAALESGEVATFDTPGDIEAVWMRPTPFLNLFTPTFSPNNCHTFVGGCSAQMLNNPASAIPPAQAKLNKLTPPNVASTTGLIIQEMTSEQVSPVEKQKVMTKRLIQENGRTVYSEQSTRHYVRQTPDSPLVEETDKADIQTSGTDSRPIEEVVQNAEKEYAAMKQFQAHKQTGIQKKQKATPNKKIIMQQPTSTQPRRLGEPIKQTNVEVVVPQGVVLSDAERAYIEQMALPHMPQTRAEDKEEPSNTQQQTLPSEHQPNTQQTINQETIQPIAQIEESQLPIVAVNGKEVIPVTSEKVETAPQQPSVFDNIETPKEEKSLWKSFTDGIGSWF